MAQDYFTETRTVPERRTYVGISNIPRRISWPSVFAGVIITFSCQVLLTLLGMGIGMSTINPVTEAQPVGAGLGIGAAVWWSVSWLVSLFIGGYAAGHMAGIPRNADSSLHGVLNFCCTLLLSAFLLTTAVGAVLGGGMNLLGRGFQGAAGGAASNPQGFKNRVENIIQRQGGGGAGQQNQSTPRQERQNRQQADQAAKGAATASIAYFFALLLGGGASALGGKMGRPRSMITYSTR